jgi:hypothetical protein
LREVLIGDICKAVEFLDLAAVPGAIIVEIVQRKECARVKVPDMMFACLLFSGIA